MQPFNSHTPSSEIDRLEALVGQCLSSAFRKVAELGESGRQFRQGNQFGENQLIADWEIEEQTIELIKQFRLPARIISEEHGILNLVESPSFTVTIDGLDGSNLYRANQANSRYCHMVSIHKGDAPTYDDYLVAAMVNLRDGEQLFTTKHKGSCILTGNSRLPITSKPSTPFGELKRIYAFEDICTQCKIPWSKLESFDCHDIACLGAKYTDLILGKVDLMLEGTRKLNLEHIIAYGILRELGGDVIDLEGHSIASEPINTFGVTEHKGLIAARNPQLAVEFAKILA